MHGPVAIVHDWLTSMRGGERVVEVLCDMFPEADLFTLTWDPKRLSASLASRRAKTSAIHTLAHAPWVGGRFRGLLPLFPRAMESFRLHRYALVISSSHCVALGARAAPTALHVAYIHSTLRYAREARATYEASVPGGAIGRAAFGVTANYLSRWDRAASARPHMLIANSTFTRDRIQRYYERDALVIEPPIETERFERARAAAGRVPKDAPFLMVSALVPNKRVELAVAAFQGRPERLIILGDGPERQKLERLAAPNVTFRARVDEAELDALYAGCRALVHTAVDDFGMVMPEAMATGKPVLACAEGGALDIVRDGETGLLIDGASVEAVRSTLDRFNRLPESAFDAASLQRSAKRFDRATFERRFHDALQVARQMQRSVMSGRGIDPSPIEPPVEHAVAKHSPRQMGAKRALDVIGAACGLIATAPLMLALGTWIRLDSSGPALFRQSRAGRGQRPFTLVKLRTLDDRCEVTRAGRLLRPTGLDELPQLWNVLVGDMSLIGPRPEVPERVTIFERDVPGYASRHCMRPGITGFAQVNGLRGNVSIAERLRHDLQYIRKWNLALDGQILVRTVSSVLTDTWRDLRA